MPLYPPNQVNDSKKGSNGAAGCRSGNLHSERGVFSLGPAIIINSQIFLRLGEVTKIELG